MPKEAQAVLRGEGIESFGQGAQEFGESASGGLAQMGFEFGKGLFNGVEIGAVGRQVPHAGASGGDELLDLLDFMGGEVVENDDVALPEFGTENLLEVGREDVGVDGPFDQEWCLDTLRAQGGDEGGGLPVAVGNGPDTALACRTSAIESRHAGVEPGFVDEDQPRTVPVGLAGAPARAGDFHIRPILLGGARRFFYSSSRGGRDGARGR